MANARSGCAAVFAKREKKRKEAIDGRVKGYYWPGRGCVKVAAEMEELIYLHGGSQRLNAERHRLQGR